MHFVVELFLDRAAEAAVRAVRAELADLIPGGVPGPEARPHAAMAVYDRADVDGLRADLAAFAAGRPVVEVGLESWGAFAGVEAVVFLAPVVTRDLLALHEDFHGRFAAFGPIPPYYRPGGRVPHCTLATGFVADLLPRVVETCHRAVRQIGGRIESIGLVEYSPRRERCVFGFADTGRSAP